MKAHILVCGLVVPILLGALGCQKSGEPEQKMPVTESAPPSDTPAVTESAAAPAQLARGGGSAGSTVEIAFKGAIVHLLPPGQAQKAAVLKIGGHDFVVNIPPVQDENTLKANFPGAVTCAKKRGCELSKLTKGITFRVVGEDGSNLQPSPAVKDRTFIALVPSLMALSTPPISTMSDLDPELLTDVPDKGTKFTAFWDLTGGTFSATPYCGRSAFVTATGTQPSRKFAETVRLVGNTAANTAAILEYRSADQGSWEKVTFVNDDYVYIDVANDPVVSLTDHFAHHAMIAKNSNVTLPTIDHTEDCKVKGTVIGCANTNWP